MLLKKQFDLLVVWLLWFQFYQNKTFLRKVTFVYRKLVKFVQYSYFRADSSWEIVKYDKLWADNKFPCLCLVH